jgi:hypothetical protein
MRRGVAGNRRSLRRPNWSICVMERRISEPIATTCEELMNIVRDKTHRPVTDSTWRVAFIGNQWAKWPIIDRDRYPFDGCITTRKNSALTRFPVESRAPRRDETPSRFPDGVPGTENENAACF